VPSQQLQGQLQKQHRVDYINYITNKQNHEDNSHKASLGSNAVEKPLFLFTQRKNLRIIRTRKTIPINNTVFMRKPIK
jgi:hypothetical protein